LSITNPGVASGAAVTSTLAAGTTIAQAVSQLNTQYGSNGLVASESSDHKSLIITGPVDGGTAGTNTTDVTGTSLSQGVTTGATTVAGAGVDFSSTATVNVSQLSAATASTVLTSVTTAIGDVAYQRGNIGADVNELTAASNVASAESVNLTSAQSSVQSTDYGAATSNLAKFQVLSQTGISALAQANSVQQEVLKLLQ
jgi:flagellin